ncbi:unnamed protein product [marine sediment metagenome]|uniref:Uncharacterized protein n=1 Tax=marine sediment metagenome TaxID=412755 RepID=X1HP70_9ZZZZ
MIRKLVKDATHPFDKIVYAPGGLLSTVREIQNYIIALINGGKFNQSQIIQKSSLEKMWRLPLIK